MYLLGGISLSYGTQDLWLWCLDSLAVALRLSSCHAQAYLLRGMWDLPRPGIEPMSLHRQVDSLPLDHQGSPKDKIFFKESFFYTL